MRQKLSVLIIILMAVAATSFAQVKTPPKPGRQKPPIVDASKGLTATNLLPGKDTTISLAGRVSTDTVKVRICLYGDDGSDYKPLIWLNGYMVGRNIRIPTQSGPPQVITQVSNLFDDKWKPVDRNNSFDVIPFNWQ